MRKNFMCKFLLCALSVSYLSSEAPSAENLSTLRIVSNAYLMQDQFEKSLDVFLSQEERSRFYSLPFGVFEDFKSNFLSKLVSDLYKFVEYKKETRDLLTRIHDFFYMGFEVGKLAEYLVHNSSNLPSVKLIQNIGLDFVEAFQSGVELDPAGKDLLHIRFVKALYAAVYFINEGIDEKFYLQNEVLDILSGKDVSVEGEQTGFLRQWFLFGMKRHEAEVDQAGQEGAAGQDVPGDSDRVIDAAIDSSGLSTEQRQQRDEEYKKNYLAADANDAAQVKEGDVGGNLQKPVYTLKLKKVEIIDGAAQVKVPAVPGWDEAAQSSPLTQEERDKYIKALAEAEAEKAAKAAALPDAEVSKTGGKLPSEEALPDQVKPGAESDVWKPVSAAELRHQSQLEGAKVEGAVQDSNGHGPEVPAEDRVIQAAVPSRPLSPEEEQRHYDKYEKLYLAAVEEAEAEKGNGKLLELNKELNRVKIDNKVLEKTVDDLRQELDQVRQEALEKRQLEERVLQFSQEVQSKDSKIAEEQENARRAIQSRNDLKTQAERARLYQGSTNAQLEQLRLELQKAKSQKQAMESEKEKLSSFVEKSKNENESLKKNLAALQAAQEDRNNKIREITEKLRQAEASRRQFEEEQIKRIQSEFEAKVLGLKNSQKANVEALRAKLQSLETDLKSARKEAASAQAKIGQLQQQLQNPKPNPKQGKTSKPDQDDILLDSILAKEAAKEAENLKVQLAEAEKSRLENEQKAAQILAELEAKSQEFQARLKQQEEEKEALEGHFVQQLQQAEQGRAQSEAKFSEVQKQLQTSNKTAEQLRRKLETEKHNELEEGKVKLDLTKELVEAATALEHKKEEELKLKQEVERQKQEQEKRNAELKELRENLRKRNENTTELRKQLEKSQERAVSLGRENQELLDQKAGQDRKIQDLERKAK